MVRTVQSKIPLKVEAVYDNKVLIEGTSKEYKFEDLEDIPLTTREEIRAVAPWIHAEPHNEKKGVFELWFGDYKWFRFVDEKGGNFLSVQYYEGNGVLRNSTLINSLRGFQDFFFDCSDGMRELPLSIPGLPKKRWHCQLCGRDFIFKMPHKCNTGFRKRGIVWKDLFK